MFVLICYRRLWESVEAFEKAIEANIPEVMEDVKYYSDVMPVRWYAKVMQQGAGPGSDLSSSLVASL